MNSKSIETTKTQVECICELLRGKIQSGDISSDGKLPSMRKLADTLGYPLNAIWRALTILKEERYVTATSTGRYLVHPRFRLNNKGDKTLRLAFRGYGDLALSNPFIQRVYNALAQNQDGFNIQLELMLSTDDTAFSYADVADYDGVVLATCWNTGFYEMLKKNNKLVTSLTAPLNCHIPEGVRIDNFHGGEVAGLAFCNRPVEKIVLLGESLHYPNRWHEPFELRSIGFRRAWLQHGNFSDVITEHILPEDLLPRMREIERIVAAQNQFTGYFAFSDPTALMLLSALKDRGLRPPKDALVLGFDDSPEAARSDPPLASLCPNPKTMAEKLILQLRTLEAERDGYREIIYIKPRLVERESMG